MVGEIGVLVFRGREGLERYYDGVWVLIKFWLFGFWIFGECKVRIIRCWFFINIRKKLIS